MLPALLAFTLVLLNLRPSWASSIYCYGPTSYNFNAHDCSYILAHLPSATVRVLSTTSFHISSPLLPDFYIRHLTCRMSVHLSIVPLHLPFGQRSRDRVDLTQAWATLRDGAEDLIARCVQSGHIGIFNDPALLDHPNVFGYVCMVPASVESTSLNAQIWGLRERIRDGGMGGLGHPLPDIGDLLSYTVYDV